MLTSQARESLRHVETVIVDEVHAVAGTKRGAHLGAQPRAPRRAARRSRPSGSGCRATVRPARGGGPLPRRHGAGRDRRAAVGQAVGPQGRRPGRGHDRARRRTTTPDERRADDGRAAASIWPHVEEHVVDLIEQHRSTIVFANSRRLAERLTARLNEIAAERAGGRRLDEPTARARRPQVMAQSGASYGAAPVIAKAHHGSVSKEQRALIEDDLKRGRLPCVVATSSLELGIDMGAVDLVIQIESPPSVASALQRVGRAGHQVGEVSRGVLFPKHRGDLAQTAVAVERMRAGAIESLRVPTNPLDVLAQQVVADHGDGGVVGRRPLRPGTPHRAVRPAAAPALRRDARPAQRPLPERRVRRAAPAHRLGPRDRAAHRPPGRPAAGRHQRRHHPRPRAVRRLPGGRRRARPAGRRARRGDGLRVAGRRRLRPRRDQLADRGHHPRPGAGHAGARRPGPAAVLEGRRPRPAGRARRGDRRLHPRARRRRRASSAVAARRGARARRVGRRQPGRLRPRAGRGHRRAAQRPHPGGRAVPRRARRLAAGRPLALRHARPRALGAGDQRPAARALRHRRPGDRLRRRHRDPDPRHRRRAARRAR